MFQRIVYQDWQLVFPVIAFGVAAALFVILSWRALRMKRPEAERLARMPLEHDSTVSSRHD